MKYIDNDSIYLLIQKEYGLSLHDFQPYYDGSDNMVYLLNTNEGKYIFRLSKKQEKVLESFAFEAVFTDFLSSQNIQVPHIIRTLFGSVTVKYNGFDCCVFSFCNGNKLIFDKDNNINTTQAYNGGVALAKFHKASTTFYKTSINFKSEYRPTRRVEQELKRVITNEKKIIDNYEGETHQFVKDVKEMLQIYKRLNKKQYPCIIHNDYRVQNLLFEEDNVSAILDFDWACVGKPLKDLGHALAEWSYPDGAVCHDRKVFRSFLKGYMDTRQRMTIDFNYLKEWIRFSCLSDTATYFMDRVNHSAEKKPLRSYMYKKYLYFSSQNIEDLA
jgi:Ser/Thr protein kinase RdoA (MazF antagonist)